MTRDEGRDRHEHFLRRLALNDERAVESLVGDVASPEPTVLHGRTAALVRLAAMVALDASPATYQWGVNAALASGASDRELVEVLTVIAPVVGSARVAAAAPLLAGALGFDRDAGAGFDGS